MTYIVPIYTLASHLRSPRVDIKTVCLGILGFGEATGYDIKQRFERTYRHFFAAGYGSIYPALAALAESGFVTYREERGPGARPRKIYSLTDAGRVELRIRLAACPPRHRVHSDFILLMFMAEMMSPERVDAAITERLNEIHCYLEHLSKPRAKRAGAEFTRGLGIAVLEATAHYLKTNRMQFIKTLREQQGSAPQALQSPVTGDPA